MNTTARTTLTALVLALTGTGLAAPTPSGATLPTPSGRPVPPIVQKWMDAWNNADPKAMAALFTDDGVYQDFAFQAKNTGKDGVAGWVALTVKNIPDAKGTIVDAFQSGDRAAVQWTFTGHPIQIGPGKVSGGKSFTVPVTSVFRLKGGKIAEVIDYYNRADVFHQVGLPSDQWQAPKP